MPQIGSKIKKFFGVKGRQRLGITRPAKVKLVVSKPTAHIASVAFTDGSNAAELMSTGQHCTNMPRDSKWVDGVHVLNIDRLGRKPRIVVRFDQLGTHTFTVRLVPRTGNVAYSDAEKGRNANFEHEEQEKVYTTDADGTKLITDLPITVAGKSSYKVTAKDQQGKEVESASIETFRLAYYVEVKMQGVPAAANLDTFKTEFEQHGIKLVSLGSLNMEHMSNISTGDSNTYLSKARQAYGASQDAKDMEPYTVAIGYTDHLAVKDTAQIVTRSGVQVGPGKPDVVIPIVNASGRSKYLWKDIVPGEGWFVSAKFRQDGSDTDVDIPEADCTAVPVNQASPSACRQVNIKVSGLPAGSGTITLKVNWVNRMRGGLSFGGGNMICVCTRSWWRNKPEADQNQVMIHEMGHKVGMVPRGTGKGPDKTPTFYDDAKGHVGPHCYKGLPDNQARYDNSGDNAGSVCVMYGATNGKTAFCANCTPAVRKVDLCDGWPAF